QCCGSQLFEDGRIVRAHTSHEHDRAGQCEPGLCPDDCRHEADSSVTPAPAATRLWLPNAGSFSTAPTAEKHSQRVLPANPDPPQARADSEIPPSPARPSPDRIRSAANPRQTKAWRVPANKQDRA